MQTLEQSSRTLPQVKWYNCSMLFYFTNSDNKSRIIKFLASQWTDLLHIQKLNEKRMYVSEEDCHKVTKGGVSFEAELHSTQEEADTRRLLHGQHASRSESKSVLIVAEDTDIFLLCLAFHELLSRTCINRKHV